MNRIDPAQSGSTQPWCFLTAYVSKINQDKIFKKYEEMQTILLCDLSNFLSNRWSLAIMKSIQPTKLLVFLEKPDFSVLYISITIKDKNLKQTPEILHVSHVFPVRFSNRAIERSKREFCWCEGKNILIFS